MAADLTSVMSEERKMIVVIVDRDEAEAVFDRMWQWGVSGVSQTMPESGPVEVMTSVGDDPDAIARAVDSLNEAWTVEVRTVEAAIAQVDPEYLSPTWYAPDCVCVPASLGHIEFDEHILVTKIDPLSAFGLGDHPTTRNSMALLHGQFAQDQAWAGPRQSLLDVGCGSGALAVLAAQMGVPTIRAIDIADAAVEATHRNMELNDVAGRIEVDTTPVSAIDGTFDIVMANILAPTLVAMADDLKRLVSPNGSLIISGILDDRHAHVLGALQPMHVSESMSMDGWITIKLRHH